MVKKLKAKTGEYQKDGETKAKYVEIGVIMSNYKGEYALLDPTVNLAGILLQQKILADANGGRSGDRVMVSIFEDGNQRGGSGDGYDQSPQGGQSGGGGNANSGRDLGDEIPFAPVTLI